MFFAACVVVGCSLSFGVFCSSLVLVCCVLLVVVWCRLSLVGVVACCVACLLLVMC